MKLKKFISSFILKLIGLFAMTIDHIGALLPIYTSDVPEGLILAFRIIGRLALPIFLFLLFEGMHYSKNKHKYLLRIGILTSIILLAEILINYLYMPMNLPNNILDLFLCALFLYLVYSENKVIKWLSLLPVIYALLASVVTSLEVSTAVTVLWFPKVIRPDYAMFAMAIVGLFYLSDLYNTNRFLKANPGYTKEALYLTDEYKRNRSLWCALVVMIVNIIYWIIFAFAIKDADPFSFGVGIQNYSMIACILILFYNSQIGYHKKWFQIGTYIYFPLHLVVIFVILQLVFTGQIF